jgi:hypothetical protein
MKEGVAGGGGELGLFEAEFGDAGEGEGVSFGVAAVPDGEVVAAVFAFDADAVRYPVDGGMVEEECFDGGLDEVDEVVVSPDVGEFVEDDGFDLVFGEMGECACGYEDDGV